MASWQQHTSRPGGSARTLSAILIAVGPGPADQLARCHVGGSHEPQPRRRCGGHLRLRLPRSPAREAPAQRRVGRRARGGGFPRSSRACPPRAGTGLYAPRVRLPGAAGLAMAVYGAQAGSGWEAVRRGDRRRRPGGPASKPVLVSVSSKGGMDSLSVLAPTGPRPARPACRPQPRPRGRRGGRRSRRTPACAGTRLLAPLATLHAEGKVTTFPCDRLHGCQPVALHLSPLLGGRRDPGPSARLGWMGSLPGSCHGVKDNPLQGLTLELGLSSPCAGRWQRARGHDVLARRLRLLVARGLGAGRGLGCWTSIGHLWRRGATFDPGLVASTLWCSPTPPCRLQAQMAPFQRGNQWFHPLRARRLPQHLLGEAPALGLAAMLAADLPLRCVAIDATGGLRHPLRPGGSSLPGNSLAETATP